MTPTRTLPAALRSIGLAFAWLAPTAAWAQEPLTEYVAYESEALGLSVRLPESLAAVPLRAESLVARKWTGQIGPCDVDVLLLVVERAPYTIEEPEDVNDAWIMDMRDPKKASGRRIVFGEQECVAGTFGWAGHAAYVRGRAQPPRGVSSGLFLFSGLQEKQGWTLRVDTRVDPDDDDARAIRDLLVRAVTARGPARDARWSDAELKKLWLSVAPESTHKKIEPAARSRHYAVLANCPNASAFLKKLEQHYAAVQKILPFPEVATQRLLPVYLFRTKDEYADVHVKVFGTTREVALEQNGHTQGIYYLTYFEDLDDPDHAYQAARQILHARLRLDQSAWFAEGFAKYVATKPAERSSAAHRTRTGDALPLAELVHVSSLILKTQKERVSGTDSAEQRVLQAALMIEFLRDSKWSKGRFPAFAHAIGVVPGEDREGLEAALRSAFDVDFAGFEKQWLAYCKTR